MMQLPMFEPQSDWRPPSIAELPEWGSAKRIGFDVETRDDHLTTLGPGVRRGGYVVGYSVALEDGPSYYLPVRHMGGDNMNEEEVLRYLRGQFKHYKGEVCGANIGYDLDYAWEAGIEMPEVKAFRDVQVAEPLINELANSFSLETISNTYLGVGKSEQQLVLAAADYGIHHKKELWKLPARHVGVYGTDDAKLVLPILRAQERIIDDQDLWGVYNLETELLPILVRMRRRGVRVSEKKLDAVERWCKEQELMYCAQIKHITGVNVRPDEVMTARCIAPALTYQGINVPVTGKTKKLSVDKNLLAAHAGDPVVDALAAARQINKVRTTFVASVRKHMVNGRIHCTFNQLRKSSDDSEDGEDQEGGRFGRISCVDPNLQQQPARHPELGPMWRDIYEPDEGAQWASLDYSQQEPRMVVHWACEAGPRLIGGIAHQKALLAAKKYTDDPTTDNHQMMADMANIKRKAAKEIFLGLCYGMGGAKLCRKLGLPTMMAVYDRETFSAVPVSSARGQQLLAKGGNPYEAAGEEGGKLLEAFDREVPFVKRLAKALEKVAKERGYIRTISGRRCRFPPKDGGGFDWAHKALNRLIQGSSADQTKRAIVEVEREGLPVQLQVHDELAMSIYERSEGERAAQIMMECVPLRLPSKVDLEIGESWGRSMG